MSSVDRVPRLTIPSVINAVVGTEMNIWYDEIVLGTDCGLTSPKEYTVEIKCAVGVQKERCYTITPVAGNIGTHSITAYVYNYDHQLLVSKTFSLVVTAATAPSSVKNILLVGDSITANGSIPSTIQTKFAGLGSNTPVLWGSKGSNPNKHEGNPGWTYGNFVSSGSPFYNSGVDIAYYRNNIGMGATKFDLVSIQLGVNEALSGSLLTPTSLTAILNNAKALITGFLADNASTKIIIVLPSVDGNTKGGWGANYGATSSKNMYQDNIFLIREALISAFDNSAYSPNVIVSGAVFNLDRYYGYDLIDQAISQRNSTTEKVHNNAVHPASTGYQQLGDGLFASIHKNLI